MDIIDIIEAVTFWLFYLVLCIYSKLTPLKYWREIREKDVICMLTVCHSEQSMFVTVCDDTDGVLMAVMAVMAGIETDKHHGHITSDRVTDLRHMCRKSHRSFVRILSQVQISW
jgi:hypothetical protein